MKSQQRFRNLEDEEDQIIQRKGDPLPMSRGAPLAQLVIFGLCSVYLVLFIQSLEGRWFDPRWATDDSLQQGFYFYEAINPGIFQDDLISQMMSNYLSPIHYWLGFGLTKLTGDPVMTGHWIMLIQVVVTLGFIFLILKREGGIILGCFGVTWFLHTRNTMQRFSGGLQRGWAAPLIAAFLYLLVNKKHKSILALLAMGWLLHAPTTLMLMMTYGLWLLWQTCRLQTRSESWNPLRNFLLTLPLLGAIALWGNTKPDELGKMVTYAEALNMPEFSGVSGRFQMVPFPPALAEIKEIGFQSFNSSLTTGIGFFENYAAEIALLFFAILTWIAFKHRVYIFKVEAVLYLIAVLGSYFAARLFAFNLFVPQRYVQVPMTFFFVVFGSIAAWRFGQLKRVVPELSASAKSTLTCSVLAMLIVFSSGLNLTGDANFNTPRYARGDLWNWVKSELPRDAIIAGFPTHIDGVQLFGQRKGYVTYEVAHPFYDKYYQEMKRRLELSFRAHFAVDEKDFVKILRAEGVTHFIFERKLFYPERLETLKYHAPFDALIKELTSKNPEMYLYKRLPKDIDLQKYPFLLYRDDQSVVVSMAELEKFIEAKKRLPRI
jgi:hypothetical protein